MNHYYPGNTLRVTAKFTLPAETADPTVTFKMLKPDETTVQVTGTQAEDGSWYADFYVTDEGRWTARVELSGSLKQSTELTYHIYDSPLVP